MLINGNLQFRDMHLSFGNGMFMAGLVSPLTMKVLGHRSLRVLQCYLRAEVDDMAETCSKNLKQHAV